MEYSTLTNEDVKKIILDSGVIDAAKLKEIEQFSQERNVSFADFCISRGIIPAEELTKLVADALKIPFIYLSGRTPEAEVFSIVPEVVARKKKIVSFKKNKKGIHLAMADPTDLEIIDFLERKEGVKVLPYAATEQDLDAILEIHGKGLSEIIKETLTAMSDKKNATGKDEDFPIIQVLKKIVVQAYLNRSSDIHIEPEEEKDSIIRFRIDGVLHDVAEIPAVLHPQLISRIKVLAKLRTDEHQIPQDGKIEFSLEGVEQNLDVRVSIVPVTKGEKAVLRLLAERSRQFSLTNIGLNEKNIKKIREAYKKPYGMVLATGPTGCGKTTTLYTILKLINKRQVNIMTIEDPVEYDIEGVNQIQVNPKAKLTFANGLRSILRQDPNVILVGEIRDRETAGIAMNFALTGHMVLSTLHTNDAATAIPRFIDLGVEPFIIASTVNTIVAQRLVRKIHEECRTSEKIAASEIAAKVGWDLAQKMFSVSKDAPEAAVHLYRGKGCERCQGTGFKGRIGIFEVMNIDKELQAAITQNQDAGYLGDIAIKAGMSTMLEDGLEKVAIGITTIDEVLGATKL